MTEHQLHLRGEISPAGAARARTTRYTTMVASRGDRTHAVPEGSDVSACGRDARGWIPMLHIGELVWQIANEHQPDGYDPGDPLGGIHTIERSSNVAVAFGAQTTDGPPPALEPTCQQCARRVGTWVPEEGLRGRQAAMRRAHALYEERAEQADGEWGEEVTARQVWPPCPYCGEPMVWLSSTPEEIKYYCRSENRDVVVPQRDQETA